MNCTQIHNKLIFYIEKSLPENEIDEISMHLSDCKECTSHYLFLSDTLKYIEKEKISEPDTYFFTRLEQKIESINEVKHKQWYLFKPQPVLQKIGYSVLIAIGIVLGIVFGNIASNNIPLLNRNLETYSAYETDFNLNAMDNEVIELSFYDE